MTTRLVTVTYTLIHLLPSCILLVYYQARYRNIYSNTLASQLYSVGFRWRSMSQIYDVKHEHAMTVQ